MLAGYDFENIDSSLRALRSSKDLPHQLRRLTIQSTELAINPILLGLQQPELQHCKTSILLQYTHKMRLITLLAIFTTTTFANLQPQSNFARSTAASYGSGLTPYESVLQTLNTYPLAIDSKTPSLFPVVFTQDAVANYTGPLSNLTGLDAIRDGLLASVQYVLSQHQLGTTVVNIAEDGASANSTTYFTATLWGNIDAIRYSYAILFGLYDDQLVDTDAGWRIKARTLVFMGPNLGNLTLG